MPICKILYSFYHDNRLPSAWRMVDVVSGTKTRTSDQRRSNAYLQIRCCLRGNLKGVSKKQLTYSWKIFANSTRGQNLRKCSVSLGLLTPFGIQALKLSKRFLFYSRESIPERRFKNGFRAKTSYELDLISLGQIYGVCCFNSQKF